MRKVKGSGTRPPHRGAVLLRVAASGVFVAAISNCEVHVGTAGPPAAAAAGVPAAGATVSPGAGIAGVPAAGAATAQAAPPPPVRASMGARSRGTSPPAPASAAPLAATGPGGPPSPHVAMMRVRPQVAKVATSLGTPPKAASAMRALRRSTSILLSPSKLHRALMVTPAEQQAAPVRAKAYADSETKAPANVQASVRALRASLAVRHASFRVGVTGVSQMDLKKITGDMVPAIDVNALAAAQARRAQATTKGNLIRRTMYLRAQPPAQLVAAERARMNPSDAQPRLSGVEPQGGDKGSHTGTYPSSEFPSASATSFSWRDRMTPVKNQSNCGSCWAFASTAVLEATEILYNGASGINLSEQYLVNCAPPFSPGSDNCDGNTATNVWRFLSVNKDATTSAVPYKKAMQPCNLGQADTTYRVEDWGYAGTDRPSSPSVAEIKAAIVAHGPVAASVRATLAFQNYTDGVFDEQDMGQTDHAISLVGWDDTKGAWHLRNSWGANWGEGGYMWIKYGSNGVGARATWIEPAHAAPPANPTFADRYLSVANDSGLPLEVSVEAQVSSGGGWQWTPAAPGGKAFAYSVPAGSTLDLKRPGTSEFLVARTARIWAQSTDGKHNWTQYRDADYVVAAKPYTAAQRERTTLHFGAASTPVPTPTEIWQKGESARKAKNYSAAEVQYGQFADQNASDPRVHEARFWVGLSRYQQGKYPSAVTALAGMINAAPEGHEFIPFAFYYLGVSESAEGYCGYAVRNLEVVAQGEVDAPPEWQSSAQDQIKYLQDDDGNVCKNWD